jgi:hypothetical protein
MYALRKDFISNFFYTHLLVASDVVDFIELGVAVFGSETHASYASSVLGTISAPNWKPDFEKHGRLLTEDHPFFIPKNVTEFTQEWLRVMCSEVRLRIAQIDLPARETVFDIPMLDPAPAPWAIVVSRSNKQFYVVDRAGNVVGARGKEALLRMKQTTFEFEAATGVSRHLEIIEVE